MAIEDVDERLPELTALGRDEAVARILELTGGDRQGLVAVRDRYVTRVHDRSDDFAATAALTLLNRALAAEPPYDPLDWKRRWARGRKP